MNNPAFNMKLSLILCGAFLFLAVTQLSIGLYVLLRILVTTGTIYIIYAEVRKSMTIPTILFCLIVFLFNPVLPIYLYDKAAWVPVDLVSGIIFLGKSFYPTYKTKNPKQQNPKQRSTSYPSPAANYPVMPYKCLFLLGFLQCLVYFQEL